MREKEGLFFLVRDDKPKLYHLKSCKGMLETVLFSFFNGAVALNKKEIDSLVSAVKSFLYKFHYKTPTWIEKSGIKEMLVKTGYLAKLEGAGAKENILSFLDNDKFLLKESFKKFNRRSVYNIDVINTKSLNQKDMAFILSGERFFAPEIKNPFDGRTTDESLKERIKGAGVASIMKAKNELEKIGVMFNDKAKKRERVNNVDENMV